MEALKDPTPAPEPAAENPIDEELGPTGLGEDPFAAQGMAQSPETKKRTLSISEKALQHMDRAGGGFILLCVTSFLMTVHSARVLGANKKGAGDKYALSVAVITFIITFTLNLNDRFKFIPNVDEKRVYLTGFFFAWFLAAILLLGFDLIGQNNFHSVPYDTLSTAYLPVAFFHCFHDHASARHGEISGRARKVGGPRKRKRRSFFSLLSAVIVLQQCLVHNVHDG